MGEQQETEFPKSNGFDHMFSNEVPSLSLPEYAVHFGKFHTVYSIPENNVRVKRHVLDNECSNAMKMFIGISA